MESNQETETMGNERQSRAESASCERHEGMVREVTEMKVEVRGMKDGQERLTDSLGKMTEKLSSLEKTMIWWSGALGLGIALLSNIDKIKALFS